MKKLLATFGTLLLASIIYGQALLDTVFIRTNTWKGEEWWWSIKGINPDELDSARSKQYNKLEKAIRDANLNSATNFTYDSLPGWMGMIFFDDYWRRPEARENMGTGIDTKLRAYAPLAPWIATSDAVRLSRFNQRKSGGKNRTN